ncbi:preprotein translocase subunit SecE [Tumebacillus algifaecis]|uniref:Protein translocase subunit SecE n=1 Tax=Tumebacillus algifaecis TaxID=1214604 RepID=A0A223D5S8_9BACL|nr:preprotein translocase subunit SecE [Tumebacillus algifaecis]ASS76942.1 preprotein translocase subunit SecE [Tumebacillus algifaecis]
MASSSVAGEPKQSRPGFFKRSVQFFKDAWGELKRVRWPNRKELTSYTMVVMGTCIFIILLIFGFDLGISYVLELIGLR